MYMQLFAQRILSTVVGRDFVSNCFQWHLISGAFTLYDAFIFTQIGVLVHEEHVLLQV